ncbi:hypothetical protein HAX54_052123 [Datura stramonium]|uniref:B box-type domain-containing protein n=1 Tax=Datura stramonium TaxID=4076 RepID=A0ABS8RRS7_DATST|nr:hypothetical protein [Datura stramonium]
MRTFVTFVKVLQLIFCAADEAALCRACDEKGLQSELTIDNLLCITREAFFYCEVDGSSLCSQCDMMVHVGGKRTQRYLLLRQKVEVGDKSMPTEELARKKLDPGENKREYSHSPKPMVEDNQQNHRVSPVLVSDGSADGHGKKDKMIDLNVKPSRFHGQASNQDLHILFFHLNAKYLPRELNCLKPTSPWSMLKFEVMEI